jgi:hypothetical protein
MWSDAQGTAGAVEMLSLPAARRSRARVRIDGEYLC